MIDIITVNYRRYDLTERFIDSLIKYRPGPRCTLTVVDNTELKYQQVPSWSSLNYVNMTTIKLPENPGYAKACNKAAALGSGEYIGIFNNDVEFINDDCIDKCVQFLEENPDVGVVGPKQINSKGQITHAGIVGPGDKPKHRAWLQKDNGDYNDNIEVLTVIGAAMIIRRDAWEAVMADPIFRKHWPNAEGAMPEHFLYFEETAFNYMMPRMGYKVYYLGEAECKHEWHQSIGKYGDNGAFKESQKLFRDMMDDMGILHD